MIRKWCVKDVEHPPGQIINRPPHFEIPLVRSINEYKTQSWIGCQHCELDYPCWDGQAKCVRRTNPW